MTAALPIVDFGPFLDSKSTPEDKTSAAQQIDKACREVGFFYLKNHGVPSDLVEDLLSQAREFFETATPEQKAAVANRTSANGGDNARGYMKVVNAEKGSHEALDVFRPVEASAPPYPTGMGSNKWPSQPAGFRATAETYIQHLEKLGTQVVQAIAVGLNVDERIFLDRIDKAFWNLRILGYEGRDVKKETPAGIGEHTDFGILTFLLTDSCKQSLQVLNKTGEWVWADPIPGHFLVNIGDMLSEWTRGAYKSTLHRVRHNSDSLRISIPFFFDPNWDAHISPVLPLPEGASATEKDVGVLYREKFVKSIDYPIVGNPMMLDVKQAQAV